MKILKKIGIFFIYSAVCISCHYDYTPMVNLGIDDVYLIPRMKALHLHSEFEGKAYRWTMPNTVGEDSLLSEDRNYVFLAKDPGTYYLNFEIKDRDNPFKHTTKVVVVEEQVAYSPYIAKVYEYRPAPGQFINKLPPYKQGDTEGDMIRKAEEYLARNNQQLVSLGSFGGYITFGFDHTVYNIPDEYDFKIDGNAFVAIGKENGGSSEPGVVMVSFDANNNDKPDDEWYELAGSEYRKEKTERNYEITYYRPDSNKKPIPGTGNNISLTDMTYIPWKDNRESEGYVYKNMFHPQSYWPLWIDKRVETISFSGTKLANNAIDESSQQDGSLFIQYFYNWGYADNLPNETDKGFKIEWAVDKSGNPVHLPGVDFIRVYTALNQYCGWLGETSTEISGARDLHIYVKPIGNL